MQWVKVADRYINLGLVKYTSETNSDYITLYFNDNTSIKVTGAKDIEKVLLILEQMKTEIWNEKHNSGS